jgi:cob(I)alamin adenosyltransferase
MAEVSVLREEEREIVQMLETKAKGLVRASKGLSGSTSVCADRACAALDEASAILADAARNCSDMPNLASVRESLL